MVRYLSYGLASSLLLAHTALAREFFDPSFGTENQLISTPDGYMANFYKVNGQFGVRLSSPDNSTWVQANWDILEEVTPTGAVDKQTNFPSQSETGWTTPLQTTISNVDVQSTSFNGYYTVGENASIYSQLANLQVDAYLFPAQASVTYGSQQIIIPTDAVSLGLYLGEFPFDNPAVDLVRVGFEISCSDSSARASISNNTDGSYSITLGNGIFTLQPSALVDRNVKPVTNVTLYTPDAINATREAFQIQVPSYAYEVKYEITVALNLPKPTVAVPTAPPQPTAAQLYSAQQIVNYASTIYGLCHTNTTGRVMGYIPGSDIPLLENLCQGACITNLQAPNGCVPRVSKVAIASTANYPNATAIVDWISGCDCQPKGCLVEDVSSGASTFYQHGTVIAYDQCNHKCSCSYGKLINCCRERKDWVHGMSYVERLRYINTLKFAIANEPYATQYNNLVNTHYQQFNTSAYDVSYFLQFHRQYLLELENILRSIDCRVTIPTNTWTKSAAIPFQSPIYNGYVDSLGGNGNQQNNSCMNSGPFAGFAGPSGNCLARNFNTSVQYAFATALDIENLFINNPSANAANYSSFVATLENGPGFYGSIMCAIGGTTCSQHAAEAPEFPMIHGYIDSLWASWQSTDSVHKYQLASNVDGTQVIPGFSVTPNTVASYCDGSTVDSETLLKNDTANISICYQRPTEFAWLDTVLLAQVNREHLKSVSVMPVYSPVPFGEVLGFSQNELTALENSYIARNGGDGTSILTFNEAEQGNSYAATLGFYCNDTLLAPLVNYVSIEFVQELSLSEATQSECNTATPSPIDIENTQPPLTTAAPYVAPTTAAPTAAYVPTATATPVCDVSQCPQPLCVTGYQLVTSTDKCCPYCAPSPTTATPATVAPTTQATAAPTTRATPPPTAYNQVTPAPTAAPTTQATAKPTTGVPVYVAPTVAPTTQATAAPTTKATPAPTTKATAAPVYTAPTTQATQPAYTAPTTAATPPGPYTSPTAPASPYGGEQAATVNPSTQPPMPYGP